MKKKISILLAIVLVVTSIFTACSTTPVVNTSAKNNPNKGEISIWWPADNLSKSILLQSIIDFTDVNPDAKINMINPVDSQTLAPVRAAIAANTAPDIIRLPDVYLSSLGANGNLLDLTTLGVNNIKSKFFASTWDTLSYKGKIWGIPFDANTIAFMYNKDIFAKAGVAAAPTTYQEIVDVGKKIMAAKIPGVLSAITVPFSNPGYKTWASFQWYWWLWANGGEIISADHKTATFNSAEGIKALEMVTDLSKVYKVADVAYQEGEFFNGQVGMIYMGCWVMPTITGAAKKANFGVVMNPVLKDGVSGYSGLGLYSLGILSTVKNAQLAFNYSSFLATTSKYQLEFCKANNLIPSIPSAVNDPFYNTPEWKVFIDQLKLSKSRPGVACWDDLDMAVADAIVEVSSGAKNAKEALDAAAAKVNVLLAKES